MNAAALRPPETRTGIRSALQEASLKEGWPLSPEEGDPEGQGGTDLSACLLCGGFALEERDGLLKRDFGKDNYVYEKAGRLPFSQQ